MNKRASGLLYILGVYLISFAIAFLPYPYMIGAGIHFLLAILISDVIMTVLVYLFGLIVKTPSVYDPYWSVQTLFFYLGILFYHRAFDWSALLVLGPLVYYSARLTIHFFGTFHGLDYVDWRYAGFKKNYPHVFQLINFFGIHMFPTLIVYFASIPLFLFALNPSFGVFPILYCVFSCGAVTLSLVADLQMKNSLRKRTSSEEIMEMGLWRYSRHPNYLGEISFWFMATLLLPVFPSFWWALFAPIAVLALFLSYSIPAIEKRMKGHKPLYGEYQRHVSILPLLPRRKGKGEQPNKNVGEV